MLNNDGQVLFQGNFKAGDKDSTIPGKDFIAADLSVVYGGSGPYRLEIAGIFEDPDAPLFMVGTMLSRRWKHRSNSVKLVDKTTNEVVYTGIGVGELVYKSSDVNGYITLFASEDDLNAALLPYNDPNARPYAATGSVSTRYSNTRDFLIMVRSGGGWGNVGMT